MKSPRMSRWREKGLCTAKSGDKSWGMETELAPIGETRLKTRQVHHLPPRIASGSENGPRTSPGISAFQAAEWNHRGMDRIKITPHSVTVITKARGCWVLKSFMGHLLYVM